MTKVRQRVEGASCFNIVDIDSLSLKEQNSLMSESGEMDGDGVEGRRQTADRHSNSLKSKRSIFHG